MSAKAIPGLLTPPDESRSHRKVLELVDSRFGSLDDLEELDVAAEEAQKDNHRLQHKVRVSNAFNIEDMHSLKCASSVLSIPERDRQVDCRDKRFCGGTAPHRTGIIAPPSFACR